MRSAYSSCFSPFTCSLWTILIFSSRPIHYGEAFVLEGSDRSYVRFPKWYHAFENLLSFDFKTRQQHALLLYTDDGGGGNFYEISLADGFVHLQFKVGRQEPRQRSPRMLSIDQRRFNDGQWHKVELYHFWENVRLKVDDSAVDDRLETQQDFVFGRYETNSDIFVGGIPPDYQPDRLSSPTAQKIMHFSGEFRNLVYRTLPHGVTSPHLLRIEGARESDDDYCQKEYCRNGGLCYSTDEGPKCNCNYTDFVGDQCMSEREFREATFFGGEYLVYDLTENRNGFMSREERLTFRFRTRHLNGMLFYCGDQTDYIHVALRDGIVDATSNVGGGTLTVRAAPSNVDYQKNKTVFAAKFNDNVWHSVEVHRRLKKHSKVLSSVHLSVVVDETHYDIKDLPGQFDQLTGTLVYIGGAPPSPINQLGRFPQVLETSNFVGCLTKVRFNVSGRVLDFLELAKMEPEQSAFLRVFGNLSFDSCREKHAPEPVSFLDSDSYLRMTPGWQAPRQGSISFKFRTNEPDGLILYNGPQERNLTDFVAFELLDGQLYFILNLGSGALRLQATAEPVNDGQRWHTVTVHRDGREGRVNVDHLSTDFATPGRAKLLDLGDILYIGGMSWTRNDTAPASVYAATLRRGFIGCFRDLRLNGLVVDLISSMAAKPKSSNVQLGCFETLSLCSSGPCRNEGVCREGYNRYACDCTPTFYEGDTCESEPLIVDFQSGQFVRLALGETVKSEAEDMSIKFRTSKPSGLLVAATSKAGHQSVELRLSNGVLEYQINLGKASQPFFWGASLNDDRWHTAKLKRRDRRVEMIVDQEIPVVAEIASPLTTLHYDQLWAGRVSDNRLASDFSSVHGFEGQMAAFRINHYDVFEQASMGTRRQADSEQRRRHNLITYDGDQAKSTANFGSRQTTNDNPVSFTTRDAYIALSEAESMTVALANYQLSFHFRTFEANGLLVFGRSSNSKDFFALEMKNGKLRYTFNSGDGPRSLQSNHAGNLNDFKWHTVLVRKTNGRDHSLVADNSTVRLRTEGATSELNLDGNLYFGGVDPASYRRMLSAVSARHGFKGCIASVEINGARKHLLNDAVTRVDARAGCQEPSALCQTDSCANGGVCIQQPNSIRCDCSLTTYSGPKCEDESTSYKFGPGPGLIKFEYNENEVSSRSNDVLVVGIRTNQTSEAIIFRVDSQSSDDYLVLELIDGCAVVAYDVGSGAHRIGDLTHKINDDRYHVIRFTRSGPNSTFQLDAYPVHYKYYHKNPELEVFNNQYQLQVGGRHNPTLIEHSRSKSGFGSVKPRHWKRRSLRYKVEKPFNGVVSGLYFNLIMPLDLAATRDPRIKIDGDAIMYASQTARKATGDGRTRAAEDEALASWNVPPNNVPRDDLARKELKDRMMSSSVEPSASPDELLTPGDKDEEGGSGRCAGNGPSADDGCTIEPPSPTDLITPVFTPLPVTPGPRTSATTSSSLKVARPGNVHRISTPSAASGARLKPCRSDWEGECDGDESADAQVEVLLPQVTTSRPVRPTTARKMKLLPPAKTAAPTVLVAGPNVSPTRPPKPAPSQGIIPSPPRPTVEAPSAVTQAAPPKNLVEEEKGGFPKTVVISCVAIGLIIVLILVVFLVFKCRHKSSSGESYSTVDEGKQYTNLNTTLAGNGNERSAQADMSQSRSFISTRVTHVNGFSRTGKKKDVKEWYV